MTPPSPERTFAQDNSIIAPQTIHVIGIGSPHGEDIAGWEVIRQLRTELPKYSVASPALGNGSEATSSLLARRREPSGGLPEDSRTTVTFANREVVSERFPIDPTYTTELRTASVPHDILDWLAPHSPMHIVDARLGGERLIGRFAVRQQDKDTELELMATGDNVTRDQCMKFSEIGESLRSGSTHQFDLLSVLQLSATLGKLPKQLILWTVPIISTEFGLVSNATHAAIRECVQQIAKELSNA